jgi:quinol monooxygenase YgiN
MVIAILEMTLPRGNEAATIGTLRAFWDSTSTLPGCVGGGVFREVSGPESALYVEMWEAAAPLEAHVRSREYHQLLAIMETAPEQPALRFNFVDETRGLSWVEHLRLGPTGVGGGGWAR